MARKKKNYKAEPGESVTTSDHFTRLYDTMITSEAFRDLRHSSRTVFLILKMQYKGIGDTVKCPYADFKEYGLNSTTVKRAIADLEEHGFIKTEYGVLVTKNLHREPNEYRFTSDWREWKKSQSTKKSSTPPTNGKKFLTP